MTHVKTTLGLAPKIGRGALYSVFGVLLSPVLAAADSSLTLSLDHACKNIKTESHVEKRR
jgi:hypothetical protein